MSVNNKGKTLSARLLAQLLDEIGAIGECYIGTCNSGMTPSTITIVSSDLSGYGDDYFNNGWQLFIVHNNSAPGTLPQGEKRDITNYVSATGTFTTVAFSANVMEYDEFIVARLTSFPLDNMILSADPVDGSLASFISSGFGSAVLGTRLGIDKSIIDTLGHNGVTSLGTGIFGNIGNFAAQTNLQTLLAALGIPDTLNKPLYTCLVTDRLDDGTFGLSALNTNLGIIDTVVDTIETAEISANSTTTGDGNIGGTTIVDTVRTEGNDYWENMSIKITSGNSEGQVRRISSFDAATDTITVDTAFSSQIVSGTTYMILTQIAIDISGIGDATLANQVLILADTAPILVDTQKLYDIAFGVTPADGSLASYIATGGTALGTRLGASRSIIDVLGANGIDTLSHNFSEEGLMQYAHGKHDTTYILFIIPEAIGSISVHNAAILTDLEYLGRVTTITQADALTYPNFQSYTICVLGTDNGVAAWNTANLADIKTVPTLPIICCESTVAAYIGMGVANADVAGATIVDGIANIEASMIGTGIHDFSGFDIGNNTIADAGTDFASLNMSNVNITETVYVTEDGTVTVATTMIGFINKIQPDGSIGVDVDGEQIDATLTFYGPAYSYNSLNSLGQGMLSILCLIVIHSRTIGQSITITGDIGNLQSKIFGNMLSSFTATAPMVEWFAGQNSVGTKNPIGKSLRDILGTQYIDAGGNPDVDSIREHLVAGLLNGTGKVLPANKSLYDVIISDSGAATLNDANTSDTIIPSILPASKVHVIFDINAISVAGDDFTLEVKVGVAASERVIAYYNITSDGTNTTIDTGSGTGSIVKQRRIDISNIFVYTGEQVLLNYTKNGATDRNIPYKYICGV